MKEKNFKYNVKVIELLPMMSNPLFSTSSTHLQTRIGTFGTGEPPIVNAVDTPPGRPPVFPSLITWFKKKSEILPLIRRHNFSKLFTTHY